MRNTQARHFPIKRAFSTVELMVVMIVLSVFLLFSMPLMKNAHKRNKLEAAAREVTVLARYARQQAILRNQTTELRLDIPENRFRIELNPEGEEGRRNSRRNHNRNIEKAHYLDKKHNRIYFKKVESVTDPFGRDKIAHIKFFKNGSASPSHILIADDEDKKITVEIAGASGAVRMYKGEPEAEKIFDAEGKLIQGGGQ